MLQLSRITNYMLLAGCPPNSQKGSEDWATISLALALLRSLWTRNRGRKFSSMKNHRSNCRIFICLVKMGIEFLNISAERRLCCKEDSIQADEYYRRFCLQWSTNYVFDKTYEFPMICRNHANLCCNNAS